MEVNRETILSRLRKLERLATSSNEHEAALAAARYQEILFKYNLTEAEVGVEDDGTDYVREIFGGAKSQHWAEVLLHQVALANFCSTVRKAGPDRRQVAVVGKPHNVEVVLFLFEYLSKELKRLALVAWNLQEAADLLDELEGGAPPERNQRVFNDSFLHGAVSVVTERLKAQRRKDQEASAESTALVVRTDLELKDALAKFYPNLSRARTSTRQYDRAAYGLGKQAGSRVGLVQGVRDGQSRTQRRLS